MVGLCLCGNRPLQPRMWHVEKSLILLKNLLCVIEKKTKLYPFAIVSVQKVIKTLKESKNVSAEFHVCIRPFIHFIRQWQLAHSVHRIAQKMLTKTKKISFGICINDTLIKLMATF